MKCHKTNALTPSAKGLEAERQNRPLEKIRKDLTEEVVSVMKVKLWTIYQFTQTGRTAWWGWRGRGEWQDGGIPRRHDAVQKVQQQGQLPSFL